MGFEIMTNAQIQSIVRTRSVDPTLLEADLGGLRDMAYVAFLSKIGVEELPIKMEAGGGFAVTPEQIDVQTAPEWPLRARTRRIKKALELAAPMGPAMEIGLVKSADGDVIVNEGGQKAVKAPVTFRETGINKLIVWYKGLPETVRVKLEDETNAQIGITREDVAAYEQKYLVRVEAERQAEIKALADAAGVVMSPVTEAVPPVEPPVVPEAAPNGETPAASELAEAAGGRRK